MGVAPASPLCMAACRRQVRRKDLAGTQLAWSIASGGRAGACVGSETTLVRQEQKKACKP